MYEKKVLFPGSGVTNSEDFEKIIGAICDDFRGRSSEECKKFNLGNRECKEMLTQEIIKGGLTPVGKPLDKVVNKVFKDYIRDIYDLWALTYPINTEIGASHSPICKHC